MGRAIASETPDAALAVKRMGVLRREQQHYRLPADSLRLPHRAQTAVLEAILDARKSAHAPANATIKNSYIKNVPLDTVEADDRLLHVDTVVVLLGVRRGGFNLIQLSNIPKLPAGIRITGKGLFFFCGFKQGPRRPGGARRCGYAQQRCPPCTYERIADVRGEMIEDARRMLPKLPNDLLVAARKSGMSSAKAKYSGNRTNMLDLALARPSVFTVFALSLLTDTRSTVVSGTSGLRKRLGANAPTAAPPLPPLIQSSASAGIVSQCTGASSLRAAEGGLAKLSSERERQLVLNLAIPG
jgi:hypothetical protein